MTDPSLSATVGQKDRTRDKKQVARLTGKDYVIVAVFSVLAAACFLFGDMVASLNVQAAWFSTAIGAVPAGIVWMYLFKRVSSRGGMLILSIVLALVTILMGSIFSIPIGVVAGGVLAELVAGAGPRRATGRLLASFVAFCLCFWAGSMALVYLATDYYTSSALSYGVAADYVQQLVDFMFGPLALVALAATILGACAGALIGAKLFKKHFSKIAPQ